MCVTGQDRTILSRSEKGVIKKYIYSAEAVLKVDDETDSAWYEFITDIKYESLPN
jgi:hypothetical protein